MNLANVMTRDAECVAPGDSIAHVAQRMRDLNVGAMPVCDQDRLAGMITDRDITVRATADNRDPAETTVAQVMSANVNYCFEDEDISNAVQIMEQKQIRRLPILDRSKRLVGIVSLGDLAVKAHNDELTGEALEQISEPVGPTR